MAAFDVWLMAFAPEVRDPRGVLADAFGMDQRKAAQLLAGLPKAVKRGVPQAAAQQYAAALRELGAKVEIRAATGVSGRPVGAAGQARPGAPRQNKSSGDGDPQIIHIVAGGEAPYAWLTYSMMSWVMFLVGSVALGLALWLLDNPFVRAVELHDVLATWLAGTVATSGLLEGVYGAVRRRTLKGTKLPVALAWIALLAWLQQVHGSPLFNPLMG